MFSKNRMILKVNGMHCDKCKKKIIELLSNIDEVNKVKVNLNKKEVIIYPTKEIDGLYLANILKDAGYELETIEVIWKNIEK